MNDCSIKDILLKCTYCGFMTEDKTLLGTRCTKCSKLREELFIEDSNKSILKPLSKEGKEYLDAMCEGMNFE